MRRMRPISSTAMRIGAGRNFVRRSQTSNGSAPSHMATEAAARALWTLCTPIRRIEMRLRLKIRKESV